MAITRPLKEGSVTTYQAKVALGFPDILASEMDADLDTIYAAWNGGVGTGDIGNGSVTYAKLAPDAQLWRDTGSALTPGTNFATRLDLITGSGTVKTAWRASDQQVSVRFNRDAAGVEQDTSRPGWVTNLGGSVAGGGTDAWTILRAPPGAGVQTLIVMFSVDAVGQLHTGASTNKAHLNGSGASGLYISTNLTINGSLLDDPASPSWIAQLGASGADLFRIRRAAAGSTTMTDLLNVDNVGNLTITGNTATKAAPGTAWVNPSDPRLKYDMTPYLRGLEALTQLEPICFKYNGLGGTVDDGQVCRGFDTSAVREVMPECVGTQSVKLHPDDAEDTAIATMDVSDILLALVNATKELAARVAALEGAAA